MDSMEQQVVIEEDPNIEADRKMDAKEVKANEKRTH